MFINFVVDVTRRLSICLLSGGNSLRMGRDKALLPHPDGGVWLTAMVDRLKPLDLPLRVLSRHPSHAAQLADRSDLTVQLEPAPWHGPLQALARVLSPLPGEALLVVPVDMPCLSTGVLRQLIEAWHRQPDLVAVTHDGDRLQPLLAVIPSGPPFQSLLVKQLVAGHQCWMDWLEQVPYHTVPLSSEALLNANRPEDLAALYR